MKIMRTLLRKPVAVSALCPMLILSLCVGQAARCYAQTESQPNDPPKVAALHEPASDPTANSAAHADARPAAAPDPEISPAVARQFAAMQAEIEELKTELRGRSTTAVAQPVPSGTATPAPDAKATGAPMAAAVASPAEAKAISPEKPEPTEPFAYADWTWLNGNPRNKDVGVGFEVLYSGNPHGRSLHRGFQPSQR